MLRRVRFNRMLLTALIVLLALSARNLPTRAAAPSVMINEFMPNTGSDSTSPEWVELFNPNPFAVDVSGWKIVDDTLSHTQTMIGPNSLLSPNSLLVVFLAANILNNSGNDAVQLFDANDTRAPSQGTWNAQPNQYARPNQHAYGYPDRDADCHRDHTH